MKTKIVYNSKATYQRQKPIDEKRIGIVFYT